MRSVELFWTWLLPIYVKLHRRKGRVCLSGSFSDGGGCVVSTSPVRGCERVSKTSLAAIFSCRKIKRRSD